MATTTKRGRQYLRLEQSAQKNPGYACTELQMCDLYNETALIESK